MRVLLVAAEAVPLVKTGGLADVVGALPAALASHGVQGRLLLPGFAPVIDALEGLQLLQVLPCPWGGQPVRLLRGHLTNGLVVYTLEASELYRRPGGLYADASGHAWHDNHRRFAPLAWAARALALGADPLWHPHVVHAHDWHAGLAPAALAHAGYPVATVTTLHNLAYQGLFPAQAMVDLGLPRQAFSMDGLEFWGQVSFLKAGVQYADLVSTVSPNYAQEILQPEWGCGLDGVLRHHPGGVLGILNGVDYAVWSPETDPAIAHHYSQHDTAGKALCRRALQRQLGLREQDERPLLAVVSRLTHQKGLDLLLDTVPDCLGSGLQLAVLGQGDAALEAGFAALERAFPGQVALCRAHDEALAHQMMAGADVVLVPSRFEPCGLTQLYALSYGALPLVHAVGGLADTVVDCSLEALDADTATGFAFHGFTPHALRSALDRVLALWSRPEWWRQVQRRGMAQRFDWHTAAGRTIDLYRQAMAVQDARRASGLVHPQGAVAAPLH